MKTDKILHFLTCFAGAMVATWGFALALPLPWAALSASWLASQAGILKECWDKRNPPHVADPDDSIASSLGGVCGALFAAMTNKIFV
jgi:hypothetical protein